MARFLSSIYLLLATCLLAGAAGVTYVPVDASQALFSMPAIVSGMQSFRAPAPNSGTVHSRALTASVRNEVGTFQVALDCERQDGTRFDVLRFDFSGQGRFNTQDVLPLNYSKQGATYASFGPKALQLSRNGQTIPVMIRGIFSFSDKSISLVMYLSYAAQGTAVFGTNTYPVRIVDGNGNLRVGDPFRNSQHPQYGILPGRGDTIQIDTTNTNFAERSKVIRACCGSPVAVDGAWYEVTLSADGTEIQARRFTGQLSTLRLPRAPWSAQLVNTQFLLTLSSDAREITIPAGLYRVMEYSENVPSGQAPVKMVYSYFNPDAQPMMVDASANGTRDVALGGSLTASIGVKQNRGEAVFSLGFTDSAGHSVASVYASSGGRLPDKVPFEVVNAQGVRVFSGTFEYG